MTPRQFSTGWRLDSVSRSSRLVHACRIFGSKGDQFRLPKPLPKRYLDGGLIFSADKDADHGRQRTDRMFYYRDIEDPATKYGFMAADVLVVVCGLWFLWALFGHH